MYDHIAMDVPLSHLSIIIYGFVVISRLFDFFNIRGVYKLERQSYEIINDRR